MKKMDSENDVIIKSPGRINIIGEHIDYNGGHVLPAAINKHITLKFKITNSSTCNIYSSNFNTSVLIDLKNLEQSKEEWENYVIGVLFYINALRPNRLSGFDCTIESNLPLGSGISSSAALECGVAKGVNELFDLGLNDLEIISLSRDAEHNFVGTKCGIMDQFAVVKGKADHLILLDCKTIEYELIKADFTGYKIVLLNTNVSHNLASSEYNTRREECDTALQSIQNKYPGIKFLTDIDDSILDTCQSELSGIMYNRARYVFQENKRTLQAANALKNKDLNTLGELLYASHSGLQHLYEVSCKELDYLVEQTKGLEYVLGARMMGGGFGGCTLNLVKEEHVEEFIEKVSKHYHNTFNINLTPIVTSIGDGAKKTN